MEKRIDPGLVPWISPLNGATQHSGRAAEAGAEICTGICRVTGASAAICTGICRVTGACAAICTGICRVTGACAGICIGTCRVTGACAGICTGTCRSTRASVEICTATCRATGVSSHFYTSRSKEWNARNPAKTSLGLSGVWGPSLASVPASRQIDCRSGGSGRETGKVSSAL